MWDEDKAIDTETRVELGKWKVRFTIFATVNLIFVLWMTWWWGESMLHMISV